MSQDGVRAETQGIEQMFEWGGEMRLEAGRLGGQGGCEGLYCSLGKGPGRWGWRDWCIRDGTR